LLSKEYDLDFNVVLNAMEEEMDKGKSEGINMGNIVKK